MNVFGGKAARGGVWGYWLLDDMAKWQRTLCVAECIEDVIFPTYPVALLLSVFESWYNMDCQAFGKSACLVIYTDS